MRRLRLLTDRAPAALTEVASLVLRLALGVIFFAHGWHSLDDVGIAAVVEGMRSADIPLPEVAGPFTVYTELIGGALLILGAATRLAALALTGIMLGAWYFVHASNGIFIENGGYEFVFVLAASAIALAIIGPGRFSLDHLTVRR